MNELEQKLEQLESSIGRTDEDSRRIFGEAMAWLKENESEGIKQRVAQVMLKAIAKARKEMEEEEGKEACMKKEKPEKVKVRQSKAERIASIVGDSFADRKDERSLMAAMIDELSKGTRWRQDALECINGCHPSYFNGKDPFKRKSR